MIKNVMDKELLEKYHLQEAVKRFNQINEYSFITSPLLSEDGEDDENNLQNNTPQPDGGMGNNVPPMGNEPTSDDGSDNGFKQGDMSDNNSGGQGNLPNGDEMSPEGLEMGQNDNGDDSMEDGFGDETDTPPTEEEDEEVIDVDDLTQSQEVAEIKIDGVDDKLNRMLNVLNKFTVALEQSDKKIEDLKQEFEKRNPSEQERLNIRSQSSYPYVETPKDYWDKKKEGDSRYNVIYDNDVSTAKEQEQFDITKDDVKNINTTDISKSFDWKDDLKLDDYLNF